MTNSRQKGARGERELANKLTELGHKARRGQQFSGSPDSPDVVCESLSDFSIECKRTERFNLYSALEQSESDSGDKTPVVMHRKNGKDWVVVLKLEDFIRLVDDRLPF